MQTISIVYDPDTHGISTSNGYAGATIDNASTVIHVSGVPTGYTARLEFDVVVTDSNGRNRKPFVDLETVAGETYLSCTLPDTVLNACKRTRRLPTQLVLYDSDNGIVTASKNWILFNVSPSVDAFNAFVSAYADEWTSAYISMEQDPETGYLNVTNINGETSVIEFDLSILTIPATNIVGTIPMANLPPGVKENVTFVETEADKLALTTTSVQNGDIVYVRQSSLMYVVIDETSLSTEAGWQVFRSKVSWGDIDGTLADQQDLKSALDAAQNVQSDWNEADSTKDDYIKNKPSLGTASALNAGTQAGNVPILNADGKISPSQIPAYALSECMGTVDEKADLTSLTGAEKGDYAFVTADDNPANNGMWILNGTYTEILDWVQAETPAQVISVDGETGVVDLRSLGYIKVYRSGNNPYGTITGDGTTTQFVITHSLGTVPVVELYDEDNKRTTTTIISTTTTVTLSFYSAPTSSESYKVVIHA